MHFEVIEYIIENGQKRVSCTYPIEPRDLRRAYEELDKDVKRGRIADYEIAQV